SVASAQDSHIPVDCLGGPKVCPRAGGRVESPMAQTPASTVAPPGHAFVVRQPILDQTRKLLGYELLLKPASPSDPHASSLDRTSARVISEALLAIGLETLTGGKPAFLSISRRLLLEGIPDILPAKSIILQLAGDV